MPKRKAETEPDKVCEQEQQESAGRQQQAELEQQQEDNVVTKGKADEVHSEDDEGEEEEEEEDDEDSFPSASASGDESDDDADGEAYKEINVEFEFFDPKEKDFHGLKTLLHSYLDGQQYDCSGLVEAIIKQEEVGTVVKTAEDDDPIAIMTVFNTLLHKEKAYMQQTADYLCSKCSDAAVKADLRQALGAQGTGLIVSERLINCPPKLAPPLLQFVFDEIGWAAGDDEAAQDVREAFTFQRYLLLTRVYADPLDEGPRAPASGGGGPGPSVVGRQQHKDPTIVYVRPEDEYLHQVCTWSFTFPIEGRPVAKDELRPLRMALLVDARRVAEARQMLDLMIGNMAAPTEQD